MVQGYSNLKGNQRAVRLVFAFVVEAQPKRAGSRSTPSACDRGRCRSSRTRTYIKRVFRLKIIEMGAYNDQVTPILLDRQDPMKVVGALPYPLMVPVAELLAVLREHP